MQDCPRVHIGWLQRNILIRNVRSTWARELVVGFVVGQQLVLGSHHFTDARPRRVQKTYLTAVVKNRYLLLRHFGGIGKNQIPPDQTLRRYLKKSDTSVHNLTPAWANDRLFGLSRSRSRSHSSSNHNHVIGCI